MADTAFRQVVAGSASGILADVITHPLSTVKTRLQVQGSGGGSHGASVYRGLTHASWSILRTEGPVAFYRGFGAVAVGAAPAQGLYFGGYEMAKTALGTSAAGSFSAGICAQLSGSLFWVPMDVIKERLQVEGQVRVSQAYTGSFHAFAQISRNEGFMGLYRAFPIHQLTWAPFNGLYFMIYEQCKAWCIHAGYEDGHDNLEPTAQICCASSAGVVASLVTNPMDVLKTRLQVAMANPDMFPYTNSWGALQHLCKHEGAMALMDGAFARVCWLVPRLSIVLTAYERLSVILRS